MGKERKEEERQRKRRIRGTTRRWTRRGRDERRKVGKDKRVRVG